MKKNYFLILIFALALLIPFQGFSQKSIKNTPDIKQKIEKLSIYPNPVTNGKTFIYITSKKNLTKKVEFFNVLGKQIFSIVLTGKELNISRLSKGVYVLKITENNVSEIRKLVIK